MCFFVSYMTGEETNAVISAYANSVKASVIATENWITVAAINDIRMTNK